MTPGEPGSTPDDVRTELDGVGLLLSRTSATAVWLARTLDRPLLVEGPPGVGKSELARALARSSGRVFVALYCHEQLDRDEAVYSWDHAAQLLHLERIRAGLGTQPGDAPGHPSHRDPNHRDPLHGEAFLIERPLLQALRAPTGAVLLIDEVDRSEEAFEALLLEFLDRFEVTIHGVGTIAATVRPWVVLTSNDTRELTGALRRRCLRAEFGYPDITTEVEILRRRVPDAEAALIDAISAALGRLRSSGLRNPPGVSDGIDWTRSLVALGIVRLDDERVVDTLPVVLKTGSDVTATVGRLQELLGAWR